MAIRWSKGLWAGLLLEGGLSVGVIELQQKVRADLAFKGGHVVFGIAHV